MTEHVIFDMACACAATASYHKREDAERDCLALNTYAREHNLNKFFEVLNGQFHYAIDEARP